MNHPNQPIKATIVIADDAPENLKTLTKLLDEQGYRVWNAVNGEMALRVIRELLPDLVLLDILMPGMDGYEVCRQLKADDRTREIPVIFLTALSDLTEQVKGFEVGGVDYLVKPIEEQELLVRVATHVTLRQQRQQLQAQNLLLAEQNTRFQALEEASFDGIVLHDQGAILEVNETLSSIFGYARQELIGRQIFSLIAPADQETMVQHTAQQDTCTYAIHGVKRNGTQFPLEIRARMITYQGRALRVGIVRDLTQQQQMEQENVMLKTTLANRDHLGSLVGRSPVMQKVYERLIQAAASRENVIIYGETGAGKELAARTIFSLSEHHTRAFVPVNCGAVPATLFEAAFFGFRKGAFTDALRDTPGYFEQAQGGTLFLDEVAELTRAMQAKLLRVMEDGEYTPISMSAPRQADIRLIAATNRELRELLRQEKIREDFFHRLHVIALELPPLRHRKEDIPLLIAHFMAQYKRAGNAPRELPISLMERFRQYEWPGNVRELFNELRRWLTTGEVELAGTPPPVSVSTADFLFFRDGLPLKEAMAAFEQYYLERTMHVHGGHRGHAARQLGIDRKTLYAKLRKHEQSESS